MKVRLKRAAIETILVRRNWTKSALAGSIGLNRTHLSDLLAGRTSPGPRTRRRLLEILGGEFDDYFEIVRLHGPSSDEERIAAVLEVLRERRGDAAPPVRRRLLEMRAGLRRDGALAAADRVWLEAQWRMMRARRGGAAARRIAR